MITNVNVIPMNREIVLRGQTVIITNGRIVSVARGGRIPAGARRIDGTGRYLIPGLADMHTHLFSDGQLAHDSAGAAEMGVMLANGLTAVRMMIGTPEQLALRREIEAGRVAGPQMWIASPQVQGDQGENTLPATNPGQARESVRQARAAGYDFLKLTLNITPEVYDAIVEEARAQNIPIVGHVDLRVGAERALAAGQHVEHLDNYLESVLADSAPSRASVSDMGLFTARNWETLDHVDDAKVRRLAGIAARSGTYTTPTLHMFKSSFGIGVSDAEIRTRPDWDHMPAQWRRGYLLARQRFWSNPPTPARRARYIEVRDAMVKAIADAGGRIMAGSDTPEWLNIYGFALHRELEALVGTGLTPFQALQAATVNPATFVGAANEWGTIERGRRADLLLVSANPLEDIRNTARIETVLLGGRVFERAELDAMIRRGSAAVNGRAPDSMRVGTGSAVRSLAIPTGLARTTELAPGVYALTRNEPIGFGNNANSLVVVGDNDVLVVDAQFTRQATLEHIAAIRMITDKPVGTVITTHWHDDHFAGMQAYRDSFPNARVIVHANTAADLASQGRPNRAGTYTGAPPLVERYQRLLTMGLGSDSTTLSDAERLSMQHALRIMRVYLAEAPTFREIAPTQVVNDRLELNMGNRPVHVRWLGCANTRGDLIVHLPNDGIIATGDLVVAPVPFAFGSVPGSWIAALDTIMASQPRIIVPGHGPVMRDLSYVATMRNAMNEARGHAMAAAQQGDSLGVAFREIGEAMGAQRQVMTNGEKWASYLFTQFFMQPVIRGAYQEVQRGRPGGC